MTDDHITKTVAVYDQIADTYATDMNAYTPEVEREKFAKLVIPGGLILDLGCAAGRDSLYFSSLGFQTIGVDLSGSLLAIAKRRAPNLLFLQQDARRLAFDPDSFDGIWACAVLHHLTREEVKSVVADCVRLLKSKGILFLLMKEGKGEKDIAERLSKGKVRHFTLFQKQELDQLVRSAGLMMIESYVWNSKDRYVPARDVAWISLFAQKV